MSDKNLQIPYGVFDFKGDEIYLWQNKDIVARGIMKELQGWEFLQPSMLEVGQTTPKLTITPHEDGYVYVLARNVFTMFEQGWEVMPCTDMSLFDISKKNRPRGRVFLCRHEAKIGCQRPHFLLCHVAKGKFGHGKHVLR